MDYIKSLFFQSKSLFHLFKKTSFFSRRVLNQKGMSLVGALMASVIGIIAIGGITNLLTKVTLSAKRTENLGFTTKLVGDVVSFLSDPGICEQTLKGKSATNNQITAIKKDDGGTVSDIITFPVTSGGVSLTSIELKNLDTTSKIAELELHFSASSGGLVKDSHIIKLYEVSTDSSGNIETCLGGIHADAGGAGKNARRAGVKCVKITDEDASDGNKASLLGCGGTSEKTINELTLFGF